MEEPEVISIPPDEYELLIGTYINARVLLDIYKDKGYIDKVILQRLDEITKRYMERFWRRK